MALIFNFSALTHVSAYTARQRQMTSAVYSPAFAGTYCAYPWRNARLSWPGWLTTCKMVYPPTEPSQY